MDDLDQKLDAIVSLVNTSHLNNDDSKRLCGLIDENVVKMQVNGLSLFSYYLQTCGTLRLDVIRTFVDYGADVNGQDSEGRTPLHWLVGHNFELSLCSAAAHILFDLETSLIDLIELFLSKGANPCLLDADGNNFLMLAIITEQSEAVMESLLTEHYMTRQLIEQQNNLGYTALTLYFRLDDDDNCVILNRLIELKPDPTAIDHCGNTYLQNLFLRPVERYKPTVNYNGVNSNCSNIERSPWAGVNFVDTLQLMSRTMGVDITQKNNDGLIPLQVALECWPCDEHVEQRDLDCLVPDDEAVLAQLVPKDTSNDPFSSASKVWFVARLTKYGLDYTEDDVLTSCLSANYLSPDLIANLIEKGVVPRLKDVMLAIQIKLWSEFNDFSYYVSEDEITNIDDNSREILVRTLLSNGQVKTTAKANLLRKGLPLRAGDFKNIDGIDLTTLDSFIDYFQPGMIVELNAQVPNLLENVVTISKSCEIVEIIGKLVKLGLRVTTDVFINAFKASSFYAIHTLMEHTDSKVKGQLKIAVPDANQQLLNMYWYAMTTNNPTYYTISNIKLMFVECIEFVVDCGIAVTLDDLKSALDLEEPFILYHFLRHLDFLYKDHFKARFPDILIRVLDQCEHKDISYGSWLVDLVKYLLAWFDIDVNYADITLGSALHKLITVFVKTTRSSKVFIQVLQYILKQKNLDIDKVQMLTNDGDKRKKARTELSPIEYAINMGLAKVVNCLLIAGAGYRDLDVINRVKGHKGAAMTFCILYTLGHPVKLSQLDVDNPTEAYDKELGQLSRWFKVESVRIKTLKELSAMGVKRNMRRFDLNAFIATVELRPELKDMFAMKHMVKLF